MGGLIAKRALPDNLWMEKKQTINCLFWSAKLSSKCNEENQFYSSTTYSTTTELVAASSEDKYHAVIFKQSVSVKLNTAKVLEYKNLRWIHGYNPKPGVINLNDNGSTMLFYTASYCGVLYNWTTNQMRILQGHRHMLTNIAADASGHWLVTADSGPEDLIIIWDATDFFPQRTLFSPHGATKLSKVALSADAKYLLTLAYPDRAEIYWWIWSYMIDGPHATIQVELPKESVMDMEFNPENTLQFALMTKYDIWIGVAQKIFVNERGLIKETNDYELKIRKVEKKARGDVAVARLTCFTFVAKTCQILIGTNRGHVLIYGYSMQYKEEATAGSYDQLKYMKFVKLEKHKINVIKSIDGVIVTGSNLGDIHFYDEQLKLLYWIHGFHVDSVRGLSFNLSPRSYQIFNAKSKKRCLCWEEVVTEVDSSTGFLKQKLLKHELPEDATTVGKPFIVRDFVICTQNEGVVFVDFVTEALQTVLDNTTSHALSLSVHPEKPIICIGYAEGLVEMFNFIQQKLFVRIDLRDKYKIIIPPKDDSIHYNYEVTIPPLSVTCLKYSPSGLHLACGFNNGQIIFLDPTTADILSEPPFNDTDSAIREISYSPDSLILAFADARRTVGVYKYDCDRLAWTFIGKHRAHYKDISTVLFVPQKHEGGDYKLISIGTDRAMVEYDIASSSNYNLQVHSLDRMDQTAIPLTAIVWPTPKNLDPKEFRTDLPIILTATDEFKYKIVNYSTTMTLSTVLGPRFETPVQWMQLISREEDNDEQQYLVFATKNIIGLQKMPLDGNPWKHVALLAHPTEIIQRCFRDDLDILFTIGESDSTMFKWAANFRAPDATTKNGGDELDPYYCLIENGRPGWLFQEIRDLFYYIQILCQGTFSPAMRTVKDYIPIDSLPDLMRALGCFPSEYEVENLIVEAKYKVFNRQPVAEINFDEFVKLYINHRPAFGENYKCIRLAFRNFAAVTRDSAQISREELIATLREYGEHFTPELSRYLLSILTGNSFEDRAALPEDDLSFLPERECFPFGPIVFLSRCDKYLRDMEINTSTLVLKMTNATSEVGYFVLYDHKDITFTHFVTDILGLQELELSDQFSVKSSLYGSKFSLCSYFIDT